MIFQPSVGSGVFSEPGADVTRLFTPPQAGQPTGSGVAFAPGKVGTVMSGDIGTEFVLCKLTLASQTDILFGAGFSVDKDFNATLSANGAALGVEFMFGQCFAPGTVAGTYYIWLARSGHIGVQIGGTPVAGGQLTTSTTAGQMQAAASAPALTKSVGPAMAYLASVGFTANTTNGSATLTGITSFTDVAIGASVSGGTIPANAFIQTIRRLGGTYAMDLVTLTGGVTSPALCTATTTGVSITATGVLPCEVSWPTATASH